MKPGRRNRNPNSNRFRGTDSELRSRADHGEESYHGRLKDKVALIRGADSGIGRAIAIAYAREGADVVISYLEEDADAQETAKWVKQGRAPAPLASAAISRPKRIASISIRSKRPSASSVEFTSWLTTRLFSFTHGKIDEWPSEDSERCLRTNVLAMFYLCKSAAAQPADIAPAYVFLASDDSRYMTGEVIGLTGGQTPF